MAVGYALKNSGVFAILEGYNALELAEDLAKKSGISLDYIMDIYKKILMKWMMKARMTMPRVWRL